MRFFVLGLSLLILSLPLIGCGGGAGTGPAGSVSGSVKFQGKPLPGGSINFWGPKGHVNSGAIQPDGTYTVAAAPVGLCKITISAPVESKDPSETTGKEPPSSKSAFTLPPQYESKDKTPLQFDVKSGRNTFDFEIK